MTNHCPTCDKFGFGGESSYEAVPLACFSTAINILGMLVGTVTLHEGTEMVMPGDNVSANFELLTPIAMEAGLRFAIREGGRTVGAGVVSKVL